MQSTVGVRAASSRGSSRETLNPLRGTCPTAVGVPESPKLNLLQQVMALWEEVPPYNMDMVALDPRPINPLAEGSKKIFMYNPATGEVSPRPLKELFRDIPPKVAHYRIFIADRRHVKALTEASEKAMSGSAGEALPTNI